MVFSGDKIYMTQHDYIVIMAGGAGSRLWPVSRQGNPKPFQPFFSDESMLQGMYTLLRQSFDADHILIQTDKKFASVVAQQLPELSVENILLEPERRDHGPAFGFSTVNLLARDPEANIGFFYSDCVIRNEENFKETLTTAFQAVADYPENVVAIGVKPLYAYTGYGYIQMKHELKEYDTGKVYTVTRFTEKPDLKTAEKFVQSWQYLWNTGFKVAKASTLLGVFESTVPEMANTLKHIGQNLQDGQKVADLYATLPKMSIEYLLTEKLTNLLVVPSDLGWSDIKCWSTFYDMLRELEDKTMISKGDVVEAECDGCLIYGGKRLVAALGLKDIVIIDTDDALLVVHKDHTQDLKKIVGQIESQGRNELL
jgi:mannose-1-phosphate guanylyltransferase